MNRDQYIASPKKRKKKKKKTDKANDGFCCCYLILCVGLWSVFSADDAVDFINKEINLVSRLPHPLYFPFLFFVLKRHSSSILLFSALYWLFSLNLFPLSLFSSFHSEWLAIITYIHILSHVISSPLGMAMGIGKPWKTHSVGTFKEERNTLTSRCTQGLHQAGGGSDWSSKGRSWHYSPWVVFLFLFLLFILML